MIDAEFRSEERFSRLSIAYENEEEKNKVASCIEDISKQHGIKPETYTTKVSNGKEVLIVEYHDDTSREAGEIFEEMLKSLDIKSCS